jgi:hypothetical protein
MDRRLPPDNTPQVACASRRQPVRFGPDIGEVARFIAVAHADSLSFLTEVDHRWPGLSFRDFRGACVLAAAMTTPVEGTA